MNGKESLTVSGSIQYKKIIVTYFYFYFWITQNTILFSILTLTFLIFEKHGIVYLNKGGGCKQTDVVTKKNSKGII